MKKSFLVSMLMLGVFATAGVADAGGKPDGANCHVSKSCRSKLCVTLNPTDKFGVCCSPQDCPALGAQCGSIDNGCGVPQECGSCDPGSSCVSNQCVPDTTTTTTSTTTTTTPPGPCDTAQACNFPIACGGGCNSHVTADLSGCFCGADIGLCDDMVDCGPGNTCDPGFACVATCCPTLKCNPECAAASTTTTTTTTSTTSTTLPGQCNTAQACTFEIDCGGGCNSWVTADASSCFCGGPAFSCTDKVDCGPGNSCGPGFTCVASCCDTLKCVEECGAASPASAATSQGSSGKSSVRQ